LGTDKSWNRSFFATVSQEKKLSYYGHVLRKEGNCMDKEIMQGTTSGQRRRRRPRTRWQDNITKWIGLTGDRLLRSVEDRSKRPILRSRTAEGGYKVTSADGCIDWQVAVWLIFKQQSH